MRIGIISDVHSNITALEAIFDKFEEENVDKIICIGDVIGIGPYPEKCIEFLIKNENKIISFVQGNHEKYLIKGMKIHNHKDEKPMKKEELLPHLWNHSRIEKYQVEFIRDLKVRDLIEVEGKKIAIEHYPMDKKDKFKTFIKEPNSEQIQELFEEEADIYLFGHTHRRIYIEVNNKYYINPGSLGCYIHDKGANAGILEIESKGINYRQLLVEYDIEKVVNEIKELNYPLCKIIIRKFFK